LKHDRNIVYYVRQAVTAQKVSGGFYPEVV